MTKENMNMIYFSQGTDMDSETTFFAEQNTNGK